ncbi:hypothetical protein O3M35_010130 [Rhynocoris fuscipes]|uniref:Apple domain-containing protein n=1 Tax=Rhynocoris fuscipes TaxID=488301 RepID=A0AAW1CZ36_9HEMI
MSVPSLYDCEYRCVNERKFTCNVFSFRYSMSPSVPGDNCHLGERSYRSLDIYTDIIPDRDYDIYERNPNRREGCQPKRFWGSDCFERIRSGLKLKNPIVKYAMKARSLSDCESACINIPYFTCRAFSYRYGPPIIGESIENCLLTDWPLPEMNIQKHFEIDPECELYHRGSYGHGCEISRYPETVIGGYLPPTPPGGYLDASARPPPGHPPPSSPGEYPGHYRPGNEIHGSFVHHEKYPTGGGGYFIPPNQPSGDYLRPGKFPPPDGGYLPPNKYYPPYPPVEKPHLPPPKGEYPPPLPPPPPPPHRKPTGTYIPPEKPPGLGYLPPDNKLPPSSHGGGYLPPDKPLPGYYKHHGAGATGEGYHFSSGDNKAHSGGYLPPPVKPPLPPPIEKPLHHGGAGGGYFGEDKHHHHYGASGGGGAEGGYHLGPPSKYYDYYYDRRPEEHHGNEYYHFLSGKPVHPGYLPPPNTQFSSGKYGVDGVYRPRPSDQLCYIRYSTPARLLPPAIKTSLWVPSEQDCKESCTRAREKTRFRCATLSYRDGQCELSDIEQRDLRPGYDYLQDKSFWMFTWDFGTASCYHPPPPGKPPLITDPWGDRGVESTWSHFTVNGQPCRVGTVCTMNREVGVWTCPIDNGDWDYCCRSGHHCGYSDGYSYPWCYVGSADRDQWRPCSDSYYPYAHSGRKLHWPVAYLHKEGPPNVTLTPSARTFTNEYKPSIVETFLRSLVREVENNSTNSSNNATDITDSTPMFEQIDLIEPSKKSITSNDTSSSAMEKLWMWGQSMYNSTNDQQNTTNNEILSDPTNSTITADPTTNNVIKL